MNRSLGKKYSSYSSRARVCCWRFFIFTWCTALKIDVTFQLLLKLSWHNWSQGLLTLLVQPRNHCGWTSAVVGGYSEYSSRPFLTVHKVSSNEQISRDGMFRLHVQGGYLILYGFHKPVLKMKCFAQGKWLVWFRLGFPPIGKVKAKPTQLAW